MASLSVTSTIESRNLLTIPQYSRETMMTRATYGLYSSFTIYEAATGMRAKATKFLGIQMGSLKNKSPLPGFGPNGSTIEMLEDGKFGKMSPLLEIRR
jgi:hypothetical protein